MADKTLKSVQFHGLPDIYKIPSGGGGNAELQPLQLAIQNPNGTFRYVNYDGTAGDLVNIPLGFEFRGVSNPDEIFGANLLEMFWNCPAVLNGTYRFNSTSEETIRLEYAYAFPMIGEAVPNWGNMHGLTIVEPKTGIMRHIVPTDDGYEMKTSTIGESGGGAIQPLTFTGAVEATYDGTEPISVEIPSGGGSYRLIRKIVVDENNQASGYIITTDEDGNSFELEHIYIAARILAKTGSTDGYLSIHHGDNSVRFSWVLSVGAVDTNQYVQLDKRGENHLTFYIISRQDADNQAAPQAAIKLFDGKIDKIDFRLASSNTFYAVGTTFEIYGY